MTYLALLALLFVGVVFIYVHNLETKQKRRWIEEEQRKP